MPAWPFEGRHRQHRSGLTSRSSKSSRQVHSSTTPAFGPAPSRVNQRSRYARVQPDEAMTASRNKRPAAIRVVLPFVFRHWLKQPVMTATVVAGFLAATVADLFMPVFSGQLVDAMTSGASDPAARRAAFAAFGAIVALGLASIILRMTGLYAIVPFTLRIM